ncbi:transposase [Paenirhodobacter ferrireducens]|uniref:transposase n=1 Tax=Paenirhodobacter ferrireducens TaxID=1215032 RepID=UPI003743B3E4
MSGSGTSRVLRLCEEIDGEVKAFLPHPLEGDWPSLWIDATDCKVRHGGRIVAARFWNRATNGLSSASATWRGKPADGRRCRHQRPPRLPDQAAPRHVTR